MGNGMNRVLPGLYVGNYRDSKDASQLERHKITHIIAIHDAARRIHTDKEYLCIMASDSPYQNLSQYFPTCNDFIHSARIQGGNVLIHCLAGMSRSVTIAVAYIMSITSLRWNEALKVVRGARAVSNPNSGFQKQLQDFEATKLLEERRRLLEKFPGTTYSHNDEEQCKKLLAQYSQMVLSRAICEGRCATQKVCPTGTCRPHMASPRLGRQKSLQSDSSTSLQQQQQQVPGSPHFTRAGSTKSLDSATLQQQEPGSPRNWERHYGCWKNHFRHRQGTCSTPSTPILYRASKPQRTDSVTSISSIASVTSLPGQMTISESDDAKDPVTSGVSAGDVVSGPMSRSEILERNPFLATQSCPNSPRRTPKKFAQTRTSSIVTTRASEVSNLVKISSITSVSSTEKLNKAVASKLAASATTSSSSSATKTTTILANKSFGKVAGGAGAKARPSSASAVLSSSPKPSTSQSNKGTASANTTSSSPSPSPCSSPWATPPTSPAHRPTQSPRKTATGSKNVTVTASGATRWVMKRSAYKFSLDNS